MGGGINRMAKRELLATIRDRYLASSKKDKSRILDEFIAVTGHHRRHGIRMLGQTDADKPPTVRGQRIYDEAVREAVITIWEAADRICGKRLKAALPHLVESMERHGHLDLNPQVTERLLSASAATLDRLDRLLKPIRPTAGSRRKRRLRQSMGKRIPVRTYNERTYNERTYNERTYNERTYNERTYNERTYNERTYNERTYNERTYNERTYNERTYNERTYNERTYNERTYNERTYNGGPTMIQ